MVCIFLEHVRFDGLEAQREQLQINENGNVDQTRNSIHVLMPSNILNIVMPADENTKSSLTFRGPLFPVNLEDYPNHTAPPQFFKV